TGQPAEQAALPSQAAVLIGSDHRQLGPACRRNRGTERSSGPAPPPRQRARPVPCRVLASRLVVKREGMPLAWAQVHSFIAHQDSNGCCRARAGTDLDPVLGERKLDAVAAIVDAELQLFDLWRDCWVESEHLPAGAHPGEGTQHKIYRACHRS